MREFEEIANIITDAALISSGIFNEILLIFKDLMYRMHQNFQKEFMGLCRLN